MCMCEALSGQASGAAPRGHSLGGSRFRCSAGRRHLHDLPRRSEPGDNRAHLPSGQTQTAAMRLNHTRQERQPGGLTSCGSVQVAVLGLFTTRTRSPGNRRALCYAVCAQSGSDGEVDRRIARTIPTGHPNVGGTATIGQRLMDDSSGRVARVRASLSRHTDPPRKPARGKRCGLRCGLCRCSSRRRYSKRSNTLS